MNRTARSMLLNSILAFCFTVVKSHENASELWRKLFKRSIRSEIIASRMFLSRPIIDMPTVDLVPLGNVTNFARTDRTIEIHAFRPVESKWSINCNKYLPFASYPSFNWFSRANEKLEVVFAGREKVEMTIDANIMELIFHRIAYSDTGFYFCRGVFGSIAYELKLVVIVYGMAELSLKSMISYYVDSCSSETSMDIAVELSNELCKRTGTYTPLSCPYDVRLDCQKDLDYQDIPRDVMVVVVVRHTHPNADYSRREDAEECTLSCRITRMKDVLSSSIEITAKHFEELNLKHMGQVRYNKITNNEEHDFICSPGSHFFTQYTCAACLPGSFMEHWNDEKECESCPKGTYQDKSGGYFCKVCKQNFTTPHEGTVTESACRPPGFKQRAIGFDASFLHEGRIREEESRINLFILLLAVGGLIFVSLSCGYLWHKWPWLCFPQLVKPLCKKFCRHNCRVCYYHVWQGRSRSKKRRRKKFPLPLLEKITRQEKIPIKIEENK